MLTKIERYNIQFFLFAIAIGVLEHFTDKYTGLFNNILHYTALFILFYRQYKATKIIEKDEE